jgi:tetratricopeptide (TPR) repeat protein
MPSVARRRSHVPAPAVRNTRPRLGWLLGTLVAFTAVAYMPAWHGEPVWDDRGHLTREELRGVEGLGRIWTEVGATQQYYPVLHSAFWVQHRLWGDQTTGYHLVSIGLHALSAWMVAILLLRLGVPGAYLTAALFALHPVHVESVAWISELKNTLSGVFFLAAFLTYLRFESSRRSRDYVVVLGLFVLALLSKSVTATLPFVIAIVLWWRQGRLEWRRDLLPLLPLVGLGVVAGITTVLVERWFIGAQGADFTYSLLERTLIAGRVSWFYLASLVWPVSLSFNYPRWVIDASVWWQWAFPVAMCLLIGTLWWGRTRWSRGPLAGVAVFLVAVGPALGFVDAYPFQFSFVADHFQYLASLGILTLCGAAVTIALPTSRARIAAAVVVCLPLAVLTWRQSGHYINEESLYRATLEQNPASWLAHTNLSSLLLSRGAANADVALTHAQMAFALKPTHPSVTYNVGLALLAQGEFAAGIPHLQRTLALFEGWPGADARRALVQHNLGTAQLDTGDAAGAVANLSAAVGVSPNGPAYFQLGVALSRLSRFADAIAAFERVLSLDGPSAEVHAWLGDLHTAEGRYEKAVTHLREALRLDPAHERAASSLKLLTGGTGR